MQRISINLLIILVAFFIAKKAVALPIDWHGAYGVDSTLIDSYRKIESTSDSSANGGNNGGSQEPALASGEHANASFQSYLFKLSPTMIVNDAASFKAEFSTGYGRGGMLGDDSTERKNNSNNSFGNALYHHNTSTGTNSLVVNQLYMELYSDTATYLIGRHANNWGLGVVINDGEDLWDRMASIRDGITMKIKLGNFNIDIFTAKISSQNSLTRATNVKQFGFSLLYDNPERDLTFGIHHSKKKNNKFNASVKHNINNTGNVALGETDTKLTDLFLKKRFGDFQFAIEAPIMSGEIGTLYSSAFGKTNYKAKAIILESVYNVNNSWNIGFNAGKVSGHSGVQSSYSAMYLHPNYQIAELMFRYNMQAISDTSQNVYDSYITNALYWKLFFEYSSGKWVWNAAIIGATAEETAVATKKAYNHLTNKIFTANTTQDDNLGIELDLGFNYKWNNEVTINSSLGYHKVGDYYSFSNEAGVSNVSKNSYAAKIGAAISF